jgi:single-strand DNA-binding protein
MVMLLGNLGKDPEMRATPAGTIIANVSLATGESRKGQDGEWYEHTEWHNLVAFGRTAEIMRDYTSKGSRVFLEGRLQTRSLEDKNSGEKKYRTEVIVSQLTLLDSKPGESFQQPATDRQTNVHGVDVSDDDIPF